MQKSIPEYRSLKKERWQSWYGVSLSFCRQGTGSSENLWRVHTHRNETAAQNSNLGVLSAGCCPGAQEQVLCSAYISVNMNVNISAQRAGWNLPFHRQGGQGTMASFLSGWCSHFLFLFSGEVLAAPQYLGWESRLREEGYRAVCHGNLSALLQARKHLSWKWYLWHWSRNWNWWGSSKN